MQCIRKRKRLCLIKTLKSAVFSIYSVAEVDFNIYCGIMDNRDLMEKNGRAGVPACFACV